MMKWRETVSKSTPSHDNDEWTVMDLRMNQVEEKREDPDLISELPELEEEVGDLQRQGQVQGWTKQTTAGQNLLENEELETFQQATQQERTEQDPSSSKRELADLRPAQRKYTISLESIEEREEDLEIDPSEEVVVTRKCNDGGFLPDLRNGLTNEARGVELTEPDLAFRTAVFQEFWGNVIRTLGFSAFQLSDDRREFCRGKGC
ncbi:uncharacterized protein LOC129707127 [Leucoraja erinacea]|uniref:uncharacterized protein LOC129707127 n=1 Tax=Leucoraja erinaceus TaxID=7782 RepID=UPI002455BFC6|nr:uncharacterized protein LOC129707127 [Leucoraja erinacea]